MDITVDENRFFRKLTLKVAGCMDMEMAVMHSLDTLGDIIPADVMTFHSYSPETGELKTLVLADRTGARTLDHTLVMSGENRRQIRDLWSTRVWRIPELGTHAVTAEAAGLLGLDRVSAMLMDLTLGQELTGIVAVGNRQGYAYDERDAELLAILNEPLAIALSNGMRFREIQMLKEQLAQDNLFLKAELSRPWSGPLVGADQGLKAVADQVARVAELESPVLLLGETGTGKEVIARTIHGQSGRRHRPFVAVNCGALNPALVDSELFGHEKGAFTGAQARYQGRFERADGGTLFLDEIGELTPEVQVRLLRVLQEKEIERLGGSKSLPVNVRLICATHRNLPQMVGQGRFREDLYFRISVFPMLIPPLRQRPQDIAPLAAHFVRAKAVDMNRLPVPDLSPASLERLRQYAWPGNVRELENLIERALILHDQGDLEVRPQAEFLFPVAPGREQTLERPELKTLDQVNAAHIRHVLQITEGQVEGEDGAARILNIHPSTLRKRMQKLKIPYGRRAGLNPACRARQNKGSGAVS